MLQRSPGSEDSSTSRTIKTCQCLWDDGLIVCIAGGNHGPKPYSISIPGVVQKSSLLVPATIIFK